VSDNNSAGSTATTAAKPQTRTFG